MHKQPLSRPLQLTYHGRILEAAIEAAILSVIELKDSLNDWDSQVGDGDCGSTVSCCPFAVFYVLFCC